MPRRHDVHQPHLNTALNHAYTLLTRPQMEHGSFDLLDKTFGEKKNGGKVAKAGYIRRACKAERKTASLFQFVHRFYKSKIKFRTFSRYLICIINTKIEWRKGTRTVAECKEGMQCSYEGKCPFFHLPFPISAVSHFPFPFPHYHPRLPRSAARNVIRRGRVSG